MPDFLTLLINLIRRPFAAAASIVALLLMAPGNASATELNIEDFRWNLDGFVRFEEFNQLTLQVTNQSSDDFDGNLELVQGNLFAPNMVLTQPLFLAKGQSTRVVFDIYTTSYIDETTLRWGRREDQSYVPVSPDGIWSWNNVKAEKEAAELPPVAWITDGSRAPITVGGTVRELPARWVPISAASLPTDSVIAMSSDPPLQPAQRQALADWVRMGGTVHIFRQGDSFDSFADELSFLNLNVPKQVVGRGLVVRHQRSASAMQSEDWRTLSRDAHPGRNFMEAEHNYGNMYNQLQNGFSDAVYQALSIVHRPQVYWPLIFLLFFVYIAAILFGGILVSRKTRDWKATYATLGILIGLFSGLFWYVGARGHGEQSEIMTLAVADVVERKGDKSRARVRAWTQFFSTSSGTFDLKPVDGRVAFRPRERSDEIIVDGPEGLLRRRVPLFSAASFQWQGLSELTTPTVTAAQYDATERVATLEGNGFSADAKLQLIVGGQTTSLSWKDGKLVSTGWQSEQVRTSLEPNAHSLGRNRRNNLDRESARREVLDASSSWLTQFANYTNEASAASQDDAGVLIVVDQLPPEMKSVYGPDLLESGRILYRIPVRFDLVDTESGETAASLSTQPTVAAAD